MPHKDRAARLAYLRAWKLRKRPAPQPVPQPDPALPPSGALELSPNGTQVRCHACGRWLRALNTQLKTHGMTADSYRAEYGLPRTLSLLPPVTQANYRAPTAARDQGARYAHALPPPTPRPAGQEQRLGVRVEASRQRTGIHTRGGHKARPRGAP